MLFTTLAKIRQRKPCESGWRKLLAHLGKTAADDEPLSLATIYASNGFDDALWCLRAVDDADYFMRRFALDCARAVEHLNPDPRVKKCNDTFERFLAGQATDEDLDAAGDAVAHDDDDDAAIYAAIAARAAVSAAAARAARAAAWAAARNAGRADASDAARAATWAARTAVSAAAASHSARHAVICAASAAAWDAETWDAANAAAWHALGAHFIACLNAWPEGEWPKPPKLTKSMEA